MTWSMVCTQIQPLLIESANDPIRVGDMRVLGVDEDVWHHRFPFRCGPKEFTGMVNLARGPHATARQLDPVPGRSGKAYLDWLDESGRTFQGGVQIAMLDPLQKYKNEVVEQLEGATRALEAFQIVKRGTAAIADVRRRIQQETLGYSGR